ncbi:MAG: ABC transporter ATP-binding protein [Candidatus Fermentibacteraceae bacterium]|nr:ABC transporter ATP-binding protein [Candidatus Fermentibacteraceae bacterium]MBN2607499.1 ABC transporter ATP-binding protein [Candidatus Fermentibacteraceae bacterium]
MQPALLAEDLCYSYGSVRAVDGISFHVDPGEILGFLGPNGAGKSTTIKMLTGQLEPDSGKVTLLGKSMSRDDPELQARIGVCFEEKNLYINMTARENLDFFAGLFGIRHPDTLNLLEKVGLADRADERVSRYSKGLKQRLMMARALINAPDILFLDEPTDGLDPVSSRTLRGIIREQARRGAAVLLTTHDMWEADELSDRVAFISEGSIHAIDTPDALKIRYGSRSVRIRLSTAGGTREEVVPLGSTEAAERISLLAASPDLMTIHTEEATLEAVFIEITGKELGI